MEADVADVAEPVMAVKGPTEIRFLHVAYDAGEVQLHLDGRVVDAAKNVTPMDGTPPVIEVMEGERTFRLLPALSPDEKDEEENPAPLAELKIEVKGDRKMLLVSSGGEGKPFELFLIPDDQRAKPVEGEALVRIVHAAASVPPLDVSIGPSDVSGWVFPNVGYRRGTSYARGQAGKFTLNAVSHKTPAAGPVFTIDGLSVDAGRDYLVVLSDVRSASGQHKRAWVIPGPEPAAVEPEQPK
jgi:hypothetical protein